ncbi:MAG: exopolyphosphatase [Burkholderiales bacterium]|jgi:exopolyphosphatase/guanosine-5'-triphosphate,3'-diphosphate pyrophosphatase|nr:exopolyphosphatase [Burkholderiales bacterium]
MQNGTLLAALDLGSNSFRLEIGRLDHGQIHRTEYLKETVRQGNGLDENRNLSAEAMQRGWDCLARFAERLAGFKPHQVRAVATQTLREARNRDAFLSRAHEILGFPIDVIPGREEARLIYQGVARLLPQSDERRLVVDIGGRSTEMILGQAYEANVMESFRVGSVAWSMKYFPQGQFTRDAFRIAEIAAKAVLDEAVNAYRRDTWDVAYGSSGTVGAVADILHAAGWPLNLITREGLDWISDRLLKAQTVEKLRIEGMKDDRKLVIGGGISVLRAIFDLLGIDEMHAADGALRHGVLYDLVTRGQEETDLRAVSVQRMAARFVVDADQAQRVAQTASHLFGQMQERSGVPAAEITRLQRKLHWAGQLHEIGSQISHNDYHRHGAYILGHADLPGFALSELQRLSQLVLGHRGKLHKLECDFNDADYMQQLLSLRVAAILCHARRDPDVEGLELELGDSTQFSLSTRPGWSQAYPQSAHLLREEALAWQKTPWALLLSEA